MEPTAPWAAILLAGFDVHPSPRYSRLREVSPLFSRPTTVEWSVIFDGLCVASEMLDWKGAGFVRCRPDEVQGVQAELWRICDETNVKFAEYIERGTVHFATSDWLEGERVLAASFEPTQDAYLGNFLGHA